MSTVSNSDKDLATGTSITGWPHWLRWMLAIGAFAIIPFFTVFYMGPTWSFPLPKGVVGMFAPLVMYVLGFTQILLSTALVPKHQLKWAGIFAILNTINGLLLLLLADDVIKSISLVVTGWVAYYMLKKYLT